LVLNPSFITSLQPLIDNYQWSRIVWDKLSHYFACNWNLKRYNDLTKGKTILEEVYVRMSDLLEELGQAVFDMDEDKTVELTEKAIDEGLEPEKILNEGLVPAMDEVGDEYEKGDRYVPEMLLSAEAMKGAMKLLRPLLAESGVEPAGIVVMGTVEGDLHDIGQNLVSMMLEGAGFEVINLGPETPAEER
jgi:methanogenic corrinoid protein MtbC1